MQDDLKIEKCSSSNEEQYEKLLGNAKSPSVVQAKLTLPKDESRRKSDNSLLGNFNRSLRMSIGAENGHVFSRLVLLPFFFVFTAQK